MNDNYLKHYNHNHDALGRFSGSGGASRSVASRYSNINRRQEKIDKLNSKINSDRNQKKMVRAAKYTPKLQKARVKAYKATNRIAYGKGTKRDSRKIAKAQKYEKKVAGYSRRNLKWEYKVSKLEYKNNKDAKKINKLVGKYGNTALSQVQSSDKTATVKKYLTANQYNKKKYKF